MSKTRKIRKKHKNRHNKYKHTNTKKKKKIHFDASKVHPASLFISHNK